VSVHGQNGRQPPSTKSPLLDESSSILTRLEVPPALIEHIAQRVVQILAAQAPTASAPWLSTEQAADYIAAKPARIHDLVALGRLTPRRDGRRLLFKRSDLDDYIEASV
jgi:excisionase family DNA binding protein